MENRNEVIDIMLEALQGLKASQPEKKESGADDTAEVDQAQIKGEPGTGFEKAGDKGPFNCGNCSFMEDGCTQETMKAKSTQPKNKKGNVIVDPDDCCEFVDRVGKKRA